MSGEINKFTDLKVWRDSHISTIKIYKLTEDFPRNEEFGLSSQMRRAASSMGANIAEGFGRFHFKDRLRFFQNSRGSAFELQNHLYLARDPGYIESTTTDEISSEIDEILKEINGLIRSINERIDK